VADTEKRTSLPRHGIKIFVALAPVKTREIHVSQHKEELRFYKTSYEHLTINLKIEIS
jgi:hypothetical protein